MRTVRRIVLYYVFDVLLGRERKYNGCDECTMASMCDCLYNCLCSEMGDGHGNFNIEDVEVVQE